MPDLDCVRFGSEHITSDDLQSKLNFQVKVYRISMISVYTALLFVLLDNIRITADAVKKNLDNQNYPLYVCIPVATILIFSAIVFGVLYRTRELPVDPIQAEAPPEYEALKTEYLDKMQTLVNQYAQEFGISSTISVHILPPGPSGIGQVNAAAIVNALSCGADLTNKILVTTGLLQVIKAQQASLELTLAHECAHIKHDFSIFDRMIYLILHSDRTCFVSVFTLFYVTPCLTLDILNYVISKSQPVFLFNILLLTNTLLNLAPLSRLLYPRLSYLREMRADVEALNLGLKCEFEKSSYEAMIRDYQNPGPKFVPSSTIADYGKVIRRLACSNLHPANWRRIELLLQMSPKKYALSAQRGCDALKVRHQSKVIERNILTGAAALFTLQTLFSAYVFYLQYQKNSGENIYSMITPAILLAMPVLSLGITLNHLHAVVAGKKKLYSLIHAPDTAALSRESAPLLCSVNGV